MTPVDERAGSRVLARLEELFGIGEPPLANRPGLSGAEQDACELVAGWMRATGMDVGYDVAGNLVGRLVGTEPDLPQVWTGSHLDTVPAGGRFDGALGVVVGVEALAALSRGARPRRTVSVIAFRDEEGWRFGQGFFGSRAVCGAVPAEELSTPDAGGVTIAAALRALGFDAVTGSRPVPPPFCFVESHIEQGPVLARQRAALGVVTGIVGMSGFDVTFDGRAGHAGTTPMEIRADALAAAADMHVELRSRVASLPEAVATVGRLDVRPGAANVIPGRVSLSVDARSPNQGDLARLEGEIDDCATSAARRNGCSATVTRLWHADPVTMHPVPTEALHDAFDTVGQPVRSLVSGAGHDTAILADAGIPTAMLFVRSLADGVSHTPDEDTDEYAIDQAVRVLTEALSRLAQTA